MQRTDLRTMTLGRRVVFDGMPHVSHNHFVPRDRAAISCLILCAMLTAPCVSVCSGWLSSAGERMACCVGKAQDEADACCASGESRQNADVLAGLAIAALPVPAVDADRIESILTASQIFTPQWDSHDRVPSESDRHVLLSVFLI